MSQWPGRAARSIPSPGHCAQRAPDSSFILSGHLMAPGAAGTGQIDDATLEMRWTSL